MAAYDDRPISMYDNLNLPASTPKPKAQSTMPLTTSPISTNEAASSPYTDISFRFNDTNSQKQQQQQLLLQHERQREQQQQQQHQQNQIHLLPSSNQNFISTLNQLHPITMASSNSNNYTYATPFKPTITHTVTNPTPLQSSSSSSSSRATSTTAATTGNATAVANSSPAPRPLSQHSQSDLNEATSQSIAAVKAALHDAKSKFFGLNGYSPNENNLNNNLNNNNNNNNNNNQQNQPLLYDPNNPYYTTLTTQLRPKVQILTPPPKPQPKYQNIPENSAVFRNQTPPQRPPKPLHFQSSSPDREIPSNNCFEETHRNQQQPQQEQPANMSNIQQPTSSAYATPTRSNTNYKQIPLNDIDCSTPSQAVYMTTTVPQNIKGSKIAGRHTPTRNSLRHSRMLVISNKNYQGIDHPNPMNFKYPNLARWLLILQIFIGCLLSCLSIWILCLAPNTPIQDNPYWSGLVLLLAGILGLTLIRFRRIKRKKVRENCFLFLRADSCVLSLAAVLLCCVALIFAAIHFARLYASDTMCESSNILLEQASCRCTFNTPREILEAATQNTTKDDEKAIWLSNGQRVKQNGGDFVADRSYQVEYRDLSCSEVTCEWTTILGFSMSLNGLGLIVSFIYIVLLACHRYDSERLYTSVQTSTF